MERRVIELEWELSQMPKGTIVWKKTTGGRQPYLQWREGEKVISKYIPEDQVESVSCMVERRKQLQLELGQWKTHERTHRSTKVQNPFYLHVLFGERLRALIQTTVKPEKRDCYHALTTFLYGPVNPRICALYGLRRTGKTTLLHQLLFDMSPEDFTKACYIKVQKGESMGMLDHDLRLLCDAGFRYVMIDEITFLDDFIDTASLLSDIYAGMGMKILISGTDSLGIWLSSHEELYDRTYLVHTTWIPFAEHARLLGVQDVDEYIQYGGTLRAGETDFGDPELKSEEVSFRDEESTRRYIDTAICTNIQHSLQCYENGTRFMGLQKLQDAGELTSAIQRVIEDINHRFVWEVLTRDFQSHDLGIARKNLLREKDPALRTELLQNIDSERLVKKLMELLDILNQDEQRVPLTKAHGKEIQKYLEALDLVDSVPVEYEEPEMPAGEMTLLLQPGMRYCQAQALVYALLKDPAFQNAAPEERTRVCQRILDEVKGRMLEEIVLLETKRKLHKEDRVFKYQFLGGEFDMVIVRGKSNTCEVFEVKHSQEMQENQCRHLQNKEACQRLEERFGTITRKTVLYRGKDHVTENAIEYRNVSDYLRKS